MKFVWVPSTRRFRRTETEVKKEKLAYEVVEFETDKDSLIDRFNAYEERIEALQAQIGGSAPAVAPEEEQSDGQEADVSTPAVHSPPVRTAPAAPLPDENEAKRRLVAMLQSMRVDEIEQKILDSKGAAFARYLLAGIGRLGELGQEGWLEMQAFRNQFQNAESSTVGKKNATRVQEVEERGLRYLALAQIADLDTQKPPASRGRIVHQDADSNDAGAQAA
jgi:hypothetical protein